MMVWGNGTLNAQLYCDEIQHYVVPMVNVTGGIFQRDIKMCLR